MKECFALIDKLDKEHSYRKIFEVLREHGNLTASEYTDAKGKIEKETYKEMTGRARRLAGALKKAGIKPGSFVGIKLANSQDWPVVYWGVLASGANALLLDARADNALTAHLLKQAGAAALITDDGEKYPGFNKLEAKALLAAHAGKATGEFGHMTAVCTSGTTGTSRVFVYDDEAISHQLLNAKKIIEMNHSIAYGPSKGQMKQLAFLPFHHVFGFIAVYLWYAFLAGAMVYPADRSGAGIMETCRRHKVTHIFCVPLFWNSVAKGIIRKAELNGGDRKKKQFETMAAISLRIQQSLRVSGNLLGASVFKTVQDQLFGTGIRFMISGGGHILPDTLRVLNAVGYPLHNGFGMTETGITSVDLSSDINERIGGGVGMPFTSINYRVDDSGEILIGGRSIFSGQMIDGKYVPRIGEWFKTGDIGSIRKGVLYIEGRKKEIIINGSGENVYPDELEDHFMHLGVSQLCVTGVKGAGEYEDTALIMSIDGELTDERADTLISQIGEANQKLPIYKRVTKAYVTRLPLPTVNGIKVQRSKLREQIENGSFVCESLQLGRFTPGAAVLKAAEPADERYLKIKEEVRSIFAETLYMKPEQIGDTAHFVTDLGVDSLSAIGVVAQLEEEYSIEIEDDDFAKMTSVREVSEKIYRKLYKD